jgi:hypothetical protein
MAVESETLGRLGMERNPLSVTRTPWLLGEKQAKRESIAQRPQRSQRGGFGLVSRNAIGNTVASGRETSETGKHRTEATEVTEGDLGWCPREFYR